MKIEFIKVNGETVWDGYRSALRIQVDGKTRMEFSDGGEPEDNSLGRDWNGVYSIQGLVEDVIEAGLKGESVEVVNREVNWDQYYGD